MSHLHSSSSFHHPEQQQYSPSSNELKQMALALRNSSFWKSLSRRMELEGLAEWELQELVSGGRMYRVTEWERVLQLGNADDKVIVVVYGEIQCGGRKVGPGQHLISLVSPIEVLFKQKTAFLALGRSQLEVKANYFAQNHQKIRIIQKLLPVDMLFLNKKQIQALAHAAEAFKVNAGGMIERNKGILIIFQGEMGLLDKEGGQFGQVRNDYMGEESLWSDEYQFNFSPSIGEVRWLFIAKQHVLRILTDMQLNNLQTLYFKKRQLREEMLERFRLNCQLLKKFKQRRIATNPEQSQNTKNQTNRRIRERPKIVRERYSKGDILSVSMNIHQIVPQMKLPISQPPSQLKKSQFRPRLYRNINARSQRFFHKRHLTQPKSGSREKFSERVINSSSLQKLSQTISTFMSYCQSSDKGVPYLNLEGMTSGTSSSHFVPMQYRSRLTQIKVRNRELLQRKEGGQSGDSVGFKLDYKQ